MSDGPFWVDASGAIHATSGDIAGWDISSYQIGNATVGMYSGFSYKYNSLITEDSTSDIRFYAGGNSTSRRVGKFMVLNDGSLYASAMKLGTGTLGDDDSIFLSTTDMSSETGAIAGVPIKNWRLTVGSKFGVTGSGTLYTNDAVIRGKIYCEADGKFTGEVTANSSSTFGNFELRDDGNSLYNKSNSSSFTARRINAHNLYDSWGSGGSIYFGEVSYTDPIYETVKFTVVVKYNSASASINVTPDKKLTQNFEIVVTAPYTSKYGNYLDRRTMVFLGDTDYTKKGQTETFSNSFIGNNAYEIYTLFRGITAAGQNGSTTDIITFIESGTQYLNLPQVKKSAVAKPSVYCGGHLKPGGLYGYYDLGDSTWYWNVVYCNSLENYKSDRRIKNSIETLPAQYENFFDNWRPVRYKYNDGTSDRYHTGFIAQEVVGALTDAGLTTQDFAGVMLLDPGTEKECWHLRRDEFVALNTWQIQKLKPRVSALEQTILNYESRISTLEAEIQNLKSV